MIGHRSIFQRSDKPRDLRCRQSQKRAGNRLSVAVARGLIDKDFIEKRKSAFVFLLSI
jgi:hypothetical protein